MNRNSLGVHASLSSSSLLAQTSHRFHHQHLRCQCSTVWSCALSQLLACFRSVSADVHMYDMWWHHPAAADSFHSCSAALEDSRGMSDELHIRLRHTQGDIGPIEVPGSLTVLQFKERVLSDWPRDGALALETPASASDLKIILSGKFLESSQVLDDLRSSMGDPKSDFIVTMHCVVRAAGSSKSSARSKEKDKSTGCCAVQ